MDLAKSIREAREFFEHDRLMRSLESRAVKGKLRVSAYKGDYRLKGLTIPYGITSNNPISGLAGNIREKILPGAFRETINSGRDVFMLWNHELKYIFGRTSNGTLELEEDGKGVHFENVPPDAQWVRDLIPSIKREDIMGMSFAFNDDIEPSWTKEGGNYVRNVRKASLFEISLVTYPVYGSTTIYVQGG